MSDENIQKIAFLKAAMRAWNDIEEKFDDNDPDYDVSECLEAQLTYWETKYCPLFELKEATS
jgi:hypothetical protein